MNLCITVNTHPNNDPNNEILAWCQQAIQNTHGINQIFFFAEGANFALPPNTCAQWSNFIINNQLDAIICSKSGLNLGLHNDSDCNEGYKIGGLGVLIEAALEADIAISSNQILSGQSHPLEAPLNQQALTIRLTQPHDSASANTGLDALAVALAFGLSPKLEICLQQGQHFFEPRSTESTVSELTSKLAALTEYGAFETCIIASPTTPELEAIAAYLKTALPTPVQILPPSNKLSTQARTLTF